MPEGTQLPEAQPVSHQQQRESQHGEAQRAPLQNEPNHNDPQTISSRRGTNSSGNVFSEPEQTIPSQSAHGRTPGLQLEEIRTILKTNTPGTKLPEKTEEQDPFGPEATRRHYKELAEAYYAHVWKEPGAITTQLDREDVFIQTVKQLKAELGGVALSPVEKRIITSDLTTLFGLLTTGEVDALYRKHCQVLTAAGKPLLESEEAILQTKTEIVADVIQHVREKNKEQELAQLPEASSFGIEIEHGDKLLRAAHTIQQGGFPLAARKFLQRLGIRKFGNLIELEKAISNEYKDKTDISFNNPSELGIDPEKCTSRTWELTHL